MLPESLANDREYAPGVFGRVFVIVLTSPLGAGKTPLLNRILTGQHGKRVAVIENEFGIDNELVLQAHEEIVLLSKRVAHQRRFLNEYFCVH